MSTDIMARPDEINSNGRDPHSGSSNPSGQAGGSPPNGNGDGGGSEQDPSGVSPDGTGAAHEPQTLELRRKLTEQAEAITNLRMVAEALNSHPDLREELLRRERGDGAGDSEFAELDQMVDDAFNEKSAAALKKLLRKAAEIGDRRTERKVKPVNEMVERSTASMAFVQGVRQNGLEADIVEDPDFQDHLKELRGSYRSFSRDEREDPAKAAAFAASTWKERNGRKVDYARETRRTQDARESSLNRNGSNPSRAATSEKVDIPMSSGMRGILDAVKRGIPPEKIRRVNNNRG